MNAAMRHAASGNPLMVYGYNQANDWEDGSTLELMPV
jgi:hypothetical protein